MFNKILLSGLLCSASLMARNFQCELPLSSEEAKRQDEVWARGFCLDVPLHRAWSIRDEMLLGNQSDLTVLHEKVRQAWSQLSFDERSQVERKTREALQHDKQALAELAKRLDASSSIELKTSLNKLLGNDQYRGILDDAQDILDHQDGWNQVDAKQLKHNAITVYKTLFIYLGTILENSTTIDQTSFLSDLHVVYRAPVSQGVDQDLLGSILLSDMRDPQNPALWVPNAGYIFGGDFQDAIARGLDCSSYLSFCVTSSIRLSTYDMEEVFVSRTSPAQAHPVSKNDRLQKNEILFDPILVSSVTDLQKGDLVIWRSTTAKGSRVGHVVMFKDVDPSDSSHFMAIEDTREDDKSYEGIVEKSVPLFREGKDLFVLRKNNARSN